MRRSPLVFGCFPIAGVHLFASHFNFESILEYTKVLKTKREIEMDYAANLALFLLDKTGSVFANWAGKMTAAEQRTLFGRVIGKGTIVIDGSTETICNRVKVCFGLDFDDRNVTKWGKLA